MKIIKHKIAISAILSAFLFFGCDHMQDSLSVVIQEKVDEDTGSAYVADSNWYYNGTSSTDMTGDTTATLRILFTRMVRLDSLSGKFSVSYTDSNSGKTVTTERDLNGGTLSEDYCSYNLNMSPITGMLDGATPVNGKISVTLSLSGFVCLAGSQSGRSVPALSQKINVLPLYSSLSHTFTTTSATAGYQFAIPVEGSVSLSSDATISVGEKPALFALDGVSSDGKSILFSPTESIEREVFNSDIVITGIRPTSSGTDYSAVFSGTFVPGVVSTENSGFGGDFAIDKMIVYDDGNENLVVMLIFNSTGGESKWWDGYAVNLLFDNESVEHSGMQNTSMIWEDSISGYIGLAHSVAVENGSIEAEVNSALYSGSVASFINSCSSADDWGTWNSSFDGTTLAVTGDNKDGMFLSSTAVTYTIPFSKIGGLKSGDSVRIYANITNNKWSDTDGYAKAGILEQIPQNVNSSMTEQQWATYNANDSYTFDMSKALEYTIE